MAAPSGGPGQRRGAFVVYELLQSWWGLRVSFLLSLCITLFSALLYYLTFVGERSTPIFAFIQQVELSRLEMRFRYRPLGWAHK